MYQKNDCKLFLHLFNKPNRYTVCVCCIDTLELSLDPAMTEWERGRERDEFVRAAVLYKPSKSLLSSRFTRAKHEDDTDSVEVTRDQEVSMSDFRH